MSHSPQSPAFWWDIAVKVAFCVVSTVSAIIATLVGGDYGRVKEKIETLQTKQEEATTLIEVIKTEVRTFSQRQDRFEGKFDRWVERREGHP